MILSGHALCCACPVLVGVRHQFSLPTQLFSTGACRTVSLNEDYACSQAFEQNSVSGGRMLWEWFGAVGKAPNVGVRKVVRYRRNAAEALHASKSLDNSLLSHNHKKSSYCLYIANRVCFMKLSVFLLCNVFAHGSFRRSACAIRKALAVLYRSYFAH